MHRGGRPKIPKSLRKGHSRTVSSANDYISPHNRQENTSKKSPPHRRQGGL